MRRNLWLGVIFALSTSLFLTHPAQAAETSVAEEILNILKDSGQINQDQYDVLLTKARDEERSRLSVTEAQKVEDWTDHFTWYGDFRARGEHFSYDDDPDGFQADDRTRGRYRARIGLKATVNEYFGANFRLSTGNESTSTNQSLGEGGDNWDRNEVGFDRLFMYYEPYGDKQKPQGLTALQFKFGKMGAPFKSDEGKDYLFWDSDIAPEGLHGTVSYEPGDKLKLTANLGYFIEDEEKDSKDPHLATVQLIGNYQASDDVRVGAAGSYYQWSSLNDAFFDSNEWVEGGLTDDSSIAMYDFRTWVAFQATDTIPMKIYGNYLVNSDAEKTVFTNGDKEDTAWMIGIEGGDKKRFAKLGFGYAEVETNSVLGSYTDSDFFDGKSNRKGFVAYMQRTIAKGTDLKVTLFQSDALEDDMDVNLSKSDRFRMQTDIVFKF